MDYITTEEFYKLYPNAKLVWVTGMPLFEREYPYQITDLFDGREGLYFTTIDNIKWFINDYKDCIVDIVLPADAEIYVEPHQFKANKIIIEKKTHIDDYSFPQENLLELVSRRPRLIKQVQHQTPEICLIAVEKCGHAIKFVKEQTPELCLAAIKNNGNALQNVKHQNHEICLEAVRNHGWALRYVKDQSHDICLEAVRKNGYALQDVKEQSLEICLAAVREIEFAAQFVTEQAPWLEQFYLEFVQINGMALRYVKEQTPELCLAAVRKDRRAMIYVNEKYREYVKEQMKK